jgi:hypothetical protein
MILLAALVTLHPVLAEPGTLRVAADGTGGAPVEWTLDGRRVATTYEGRAAELQAGAGEHTLVARSRAEPPWLAMARPDLRGEGLAFVPAWTGVAQAEAPQASVGEAAAILLGLAAVATLGLQPKRP